MLDFLRPNYLFLVPLWDLDTHACMHTCTRYSMPPLFSSTAWVLSIIHQLREERQSLLPTFPCHCLQYWKEKAGSGSNAVVSGLLSGYPGTTVYHLERKVRKDGPQSTFPLRMSVMHRGRWKQTLGGVGFGSVGNKCRVPEGQDKRKDLPRES